MHTGVLLWGSVLGLWCDCWECFVALLCSFVASWAKRVKESLSTEWPRIENKLPKILNNVTFLEYDLDTVPRYSNALWISP